MVGVRTIAGILATMYLLLYSPLMGVAEERSAEQPSETGLITYAQIADKKYEDGDYASYVRSGRELPLCTDQVTLSISQIRSRNEQTAVEPAGVSFAAGGQVVYGCMVTQEGWYTAHIRYHYIDTTLQRDSAVTVSLNGRIPFRQAENLTLPRVWGQTELQHIDNKNDTIPKAMQTTGSWTHTFQDESGSQGVYRFYLSKGENIIIVSSVSGGFCLESLTFGTTPLLQTVTEGYSGEIYTIEAAEIYRKNDSSITAGVDRSDVSVQPNHPVYKRVNTLDGNKWSISGQTVTYRVTVEKAGAYRIGLRYRQDTLQGLFVSRNILLDGQPLLSNAVPFPYDEDWQYMVLDDAGEELAFWLEPGEHILQLEVTTGSMESALRRMEDAVYVLNYLYRQMVMVCGTSPDAMRDYNLHQELPFLLPMFRETAVELEGIYKQLESLGATGGQVSVLRQFVAQLESFVAEPYEIQNRLSHYAGNISSLSSLIMSLQSQPLSLDYISLLGTAQGDTNVKAGFFQNIWFQFQSFLGSFYCDYAMLNEGLDGTGESITVWFSGGREQAELLKTIIDEDFTAEKGIGVNLQLASIGLAQSILAGSSPDVNLSNSRYQAVNLGARGSLVDLSTLDGFDAYRQQFGEELLLPYTYKGGVYALPVTLDYFVQFYRTDIFEELGLSVPQTWDEFYIVLMALQRENMAVGLPYTMLSSQATIEAGIGAKDIFATLVLQQGVSLYDDRQETILLEQPEVLSAFARWTEFYSQYGMGLEYSFYNRFRTGEMPLAVQGYGSYNLLASAAPEIRGLWKMAPLPGTAMADGNINHSLSASGTGVVMLDNSTHKQAAWEFIQWWVSARAQGRYGNELEQLMGKASRYNPANAQALELLPWEDEERKLLLEQRTLIKELPEVLGGYYVSRGLDNAFRNVLYSDANYKEALMEQNTKINAELARKRQELNRYKSRG